jgi:sulfur transfer complex TusBCD TusB component (DsrH family)
MKLPLSSQTNSATALKQTLQQELAKHAASVAHKAIRYGTDIAQTPWQVMILSSDFDATTISADISIFFQSLNGGCNCSDNPDQISPENEYGEFVLSIDRETCEATLELK